MDFTQIINFIVSNGPAILNAIVGLVSAVIAVCMIIPGPEPEATLQKVVDFLTKFSKK